MADELETAKGSCCVIIASAMTADNLKGQSMTYEDILEFTEAVPFRPFQIRMASGRTFDIRHPENIRVGEYSVFVFLYSERDRRIYERAVILGYSMMESLEYVDSPIAHD